MNYTQGLLQTCHGLVLSAVYTRLRRSNILTLINIPALLETLALPMVVPMEYDQEEQTSRSGSQDLLVNKDRRMSSNGRLLNNDNNLTECACTR